MPENEEQLSKKERRNQKRAEKLERKAEEAKKEKQDAFMQNVFVWGFIALLGAGLVLFVGNLLSSDDALDNGGTQDISIAEDEWISGNPGAEVTLVEYADFQCPGCRQAHPVVQDIIEQYGDDVRVVYRHLPLVSIHDNAYAAARAAEAAGAQGEFFAMQDMLFENQDEWSSANNAEDIFAGYAEEIGLDMEEYENAFSSDEVKERIDEDLASAQRLGATGTPTFFLNGRSVQYNSYSQLIQIVGDEIQAVEEESENGEKETEEESGNSDEEETEEEA